MLPGPRPRLRGVSHRIAFLAAIPAAAALVVLARDRRAATAVAIYGVLLAAMFGVSATLHRADWRPRAFAWLRRADHAMIFAFIAGTYTPLCVVGIRGPAGTQLLILVWTAAALGMVRALLWPHAPRAVSATLYVAVGWLVLAYLPTVRAALDPTSLMLVLTGGAAYTLGATVYLCRWPDPSPRVFGYHEVFHLLIIAGSALHFAAIAHVLTR